MRNSLSRRRTSWKAASGSIFICARRRSAICSTAASNRFGVAGTLVISRSSLYYRKRGRGVRADRQWDEDLIVAWWLRRKQGLKLNGKRVLRVMRERGLLVQSAVSGSSATADWQA